MKTPNSMPFEKGTYGAFAGETRVGKMLPAVSSENETHLPDVIGRLHALQSRQGFVAVDQVATTADDTGARQSQAYGMASFYSMFELEDDERSVEDVSKERNVIRVCDGPVCCLHGGCERLRELRRLADKDPIARVVRTSCLGLCDIAPAALVNDRPVQLPITGSIDETVNRSEVSTPPTVCRPSENNLPLTSTWGDVEVSLDQRYESLRTALDLSPEILIDQVECSGLRGRGGAGFNTGAKWRMVAETDAAERYVVCNADESEPGNFKDRQLIEYSPHLLLAGMAICGHAVGASKGIIYVRGEYTRAARILEEAIAEATEAHYLGSTICGTKFSFEVHVHRGAGAYICGEETAMLESLEGNRGEPRSRPPYPTTDGYRGLPTVVNNVETLCAVPFIVTNGANEYRELGCGDAAGTKLYSVSGNIKSPGVWEMPFGATTRELLRCANGMAADRDFKFAVTGGAAGTFITEEMLDIPLDHDAFTSGVVVGSGGVMIVDERLSVVSFLLWLLRFFEFESCGKCTPCRVGTTHARELVERIEEGNGRSGDLDYLLQLAKLLDRTSFCGLGQSVAWPIESSLQRFREDFEALGAS